MFPTFPTTFTPPKVHNCDNKSNLRQNTVCSVINLTQTLKILRHQGWCGWWHFASLQVTYDRWFILVLVLLSTDRKRFSVSRMQDFFFFFYIFFVLLSAHAKRFIGLSLRDIYVMNMPSNLYCSVLTLGYCTAKNWAFRFLIICKLSSNCYINYRPSVDRRVRNTGAYK